MKQNLLSNDEHNAFRALCVGVIAFAFQFALSNSAGHALGMRPIPWLRHTCLLLVPMTVVIGLVFAFSARLQWKTLTAFLLFALTGTGYVFTWLTN